MKRIHGCLIGLLMSGSLLTAQNTQTAPAATPAPQPQATAPEQALAQAASTPTPPATAPAASATASPAAQQVQSAPQTQAPTTLPAPAFTQEELDTALAPIALYPDSLLAQLLMATTYPNQVMAAAKWSKEHPKMKGEEAVKAVQNENWNPCVASLVAFPQVLEMLSSKPDWTKELGEMFLADPDAVILTIQNLRKKAYDAGNLKDTKEQKVVVQQSEAPQGGSATANASTGNTIIEIQPANPQTVYVPVYNPTVVYGSWWHPTPPYYYQPPYWNPVATIIGFGAAIAVGNALWSHWDWHHHDININVNRYNHINVNKRLNVRANQASWRKNVRKSNPHYNQVTRKQARKRLDNKGLQTRQRDLQRARAQEKLKRNGVDLKKGRDNLWKNPRQVQGALDRAKKGQVNPKAAKAFQNKKRPAIQNRPAGQKIKRPITRETKRPATREVKRPANRQVKRPTIPKRPAPKVTRPHPHARPAARRTPRAPQHPARPNRGSIRR